MPFFVIITARIIQYTEPEMGTYELALSSLSKKQSNDDLGNEITLLAGQINAANQCCKSY